MSTKPDPQEGRRPFPSTRRMYRFWIKLPEPAPKDQNPLLRFGIMGAERAA
jgi:hypothetical protein